MLASFARVRESCSGESSSRRVAPDLSAPRKNRAVAHRTTERCSSGDLRRDLSRPFHRPARGPAMTPKPPWPRDVAEAALVQPNPSGQS